MKIYARPKASTAARNTKMEFSQKMGPQHAYEVDCFFADLDSGVTRAKLVGFSYNHTKTYTVDDYTFEDVMGRPVKV